jgi:hypothetical protein
VEDVWFQSCVLLLFLLILQVVLVIEQLVDCCPPSPSLLQLLLQVSRHTCCDAPFTAWLAPLAIRTCCTCKPPASVAMWSAVIQLAGSVSGSAAAELAKQALQVHPWSLLLWQLHYDTSGGLKAVCIWKKKLRCRAVSVAMNWACSNGRMHGLQVHHSPALLALHG